MQASINETFQYALDVHNLTFMRAKELLASLHPRPFVKGRAIHSWNELTPPQHAMKELFRERDFTRVGLYRNMLESEGIPTFVRNENAETMTTMVPIPEFFPALCVVNDEDYDIAVEVLEKNAVHSARLSQQQHVCPKCQERNPGNFETCWSCGADLLSPGERLV